MADPRSNGNGHGQPVSAKNERLCARCCKPFWAWESPRKKCYICNPPKAAEVKRLIGHLR